jgi:hypothetical protein
VGHVRRRIIFHARRSGGAALINKGEGEGVVAGRGEDATGGDEASHAIDLGNKETPCSYGDSLVRAASEGTRRSC